MTISRLTTYSPSVVASLDDLMHELSPTSYCDADKLAMALSDHNSYVFVAEEDGQIVGTATLCIAHTPEFTLGAVEAVVATNFYELEMEGFANDGSLPLDKLGINLAQGELTLSTS